MTRNPKAQFIRPPATLQEKVGPPTVGGVDAATLDRAEKVIEAMSSTYLEWVQEDLANLSTAFEDLKAGPADKDKENLERIFGIAHDMKGQGGSFNYGLVTTVGNLLCRFVEKLEHPAPGDLKIIHLHVDGLRLVIANRMSGDGGEAGQNLVRGLMAVTEKLAD